MNLKKVFKEELTTAFIMFLVFGYPLGYKGEGINNSWLVGLIFIIMIWAIYYFIFIRLAKDFKLDERELSIYTRIGYISFFIFLSVATLLFINQEVIVPFIKQPISRIWGRFILPLFILVHALTGLIVNRKEEAI